VRPEQGTYLGDLAESLLSPPSHTIPTPDHHLEHHDTMSHRLSLVRRTAHLRRRYTGETDSSLLPAVTQGIQSLTADERAVFHEILDSGYETRLLGEDPIPRATQRYRDALLPDTTDAVQQELEAGILFALGQIAPYRWPTTEVVAPMPVGRIFRPARGVEETILHLPAGVSAPMMAMLVPRVVDGRLHGLAGLRARVHRRHVQLHLADGGPTRKVALSDTSFRQWAASLAFAKKATGLGHVADVTSRLNVAERDVIDAGRVPFPAWLGSALLRRLRILADTFWLIIRRDGPDGIRLDWAGGASAVQVAAALVHPLTGLAGDRFFVTRLADGIVTILITTATDEPAAKVTLHQAPLATTPPFTRVDASAAWSTFRHVMQMTNPTLDDRWMVVT
jgi:hypothetical protein